MTSAFLQKTGQKLLHAPFYAHVCECMQVYSICSK